MNPTPKGPRRSLDELLGLDADPSMGQAAQDRLRQRLAEARAGAGDELDVALALDRVDPPARLAEGVIARVRAEEALAANGVLVPAPAPARTMRLRRLLPLVAAAAVLAFWTLRGGGEAEDQPLGEGSIGGASVAGADPENLDVEQEVTDDLLASLPLLEDMDFFTEELDPFEADALFLFESEDRVLFNLLVADDYDLDGIEDPLHDGGDQR